MTLKSLQEKFYKERIHRDPVLRFYKTLDQYLKPSLRVLDVGAGAGEENPYQLKGRVRTLIGIDMDPRVGTNPLLDTGIVSDAIRLPFRDNYFDLVFSIYVLEHITNPRGFVAELGRVLRPGGYFLALTPSRFHYVSLIAALTPTGFHKWVNKKRGRREKDTFPTKYQLNSPRQLQKYFLGAGFQIIQIDAFEVQPNYLVFSAPTFLLGAAYERIVNACDCFASLRVNFTCVLRNAKRQITRENISMS